MVSDFYLKICAFEHVYGWKIGVSIFEIGYFGTFRSVNNTNVSITETLQIPLFPFAYVVYVCSLNTYSTHLHVCCTYVFRRKFV